MKLITAITNYELRITKNVLFFSSLRGRIRSILTRQSILSFFLLFFVSFAFADYKRIVSLAPLVTESLYELGMDNEIAGITTYCPKGNHKKEIVGTLLEPDLEKIALMKPDLIISTKDGNNKAAVEKLMRLDFNVYVMETSENFDAICSNFLALAKVVGKEKEAEKIISDSKESVKKIEKRLAPQKKQSVLWQVGAKPLYVAAGESFVNSYNYYTKTLNVYADVMLRYPAVEIENVLQKDPDIIILVNMGDITPHEIKFWKKYKNITAVKNDKIFMIDVNDMFTPTPSTFAKGVTLLAHTIYPDVFEDDYDDDE
ncbi:MAG: helical backbone metal receptor [Endomicrobia bacterium]|nr:helical backbone metal receptor [Endomicrobiia bacterium]MCL2506620.1 helical backbone metal receptor [Endomicrobiia bacterium]